MSPVVAEKAGPWRFPSGPGLRARARLRPGGRDSVGRGLHQGVEHWILEHRPPRTDLGRLTLDGGFVRLDPIGCGRNWWTDIVRPHHRTPGRREGHENNGESTPGCVAGSPPIAHRHTTHSF